MKTEYWSRYNFDRMSIIIEYIVQSNKHRRRQFAWKVNIIRRYTNEDISTPIWVKS